MLDIQQKRKVRSVIYNRISIGLLFVLVLLAIHSTWSVYKKKVESEEMRDRASAQVLALQERNDELRSKIARLETTAGMEEEIRSKFSVAKEGENVVIIVEDVPTEATTTPESRGFWGKILDIFR